MDAQQYIDSGILEAYLLGLASDEERLQVQQVAAVNPQVSTALKELETFLETQWLQQAVPPPPNTEELLRDRLEKAELKRRDEPVHAFTNGKATGTDRNQPAYVEAEVSDTHLRVHKYWRVAFILVFILSKVFLILGLYFYFKANSLEAEVERLKTEIRQNASTP